ncbi:ecto-ADP-ribosyltransferase 5-like [Bombina bombina]|uniref:ecto-ADP-ribosyltransferase 5-like n=1 Tax=Bombina bombina TaxID=8345 RepID=UPI00235AE726|nr:ecto-ADP-ribosyltransferase 5-like [Bombina bombina]
MGIDKVKCQAYELNMRANHFDDQYRGCEDEMEREANQLLQDEKKKNSDFKEVWEHSQKNWNKLKKQKNIKIPAGLKDNYGIAVVTFTENYPEKNPFHKQLNDKLTEAGESVENYRKKFNFKAFHFYLTRALQVLRTQKDKSKIYKTYRGSKVSSNVANFVRFGRFTSSSLNRNEAKTFGEKSFFNISTRFGVNITAYSIYPNEEEVLIPGTEQFQKKSHKGNAYNLTSTGQMCSYFNCAYFTGNKRTKKYPGKTKKPMCHRDTSGSIDSNRSHVASGCTKEVWVQLSLKSVIFEH